MQLSPRLLWDESYDFDIEAEEVAKARGLVVVLPQPNQLQIDIDSDELLSEFESRFETFQWREAFKPKKVDVKNSQHPGHYHVTITLSEDVTEWQRLALQAALGDDPMRSYLNAMRAQFGVKNPSRLFEKP